MGINSFILLGGTVTVTSSIKRYGGPQDFDLMLKTLIKGIAVFTGIIVVWLALAII
jgi:hypothetical protein